MVTILILLITRKNYDSLQKHGHAFGYFLQVPFFKHICWKKYSRFLIPREVELGEGYGVLSNVVGSGNADPNFVVRPLLKQKRLLKKLVFHDGALPRIIRSSFI